MVAVILHITKNSAAKLRSNEFQGFWYEWELNWKLNPTLSSPCPLLSSALERVISSFLVGLVLEIVALFPTLIKPYLNFGYHFIYTRLNLHLGYSCLNLKQSFFADTLSPHILIDLILCLCWNFWSHSFKNSIVFSGKLSDFGNLCS